MVSSDPVADLLESLAAAEHVGWAAWMSYLFGQCARNADGSLTIPAHFVRHWQRQIDTPYAQLSEEEKEADRDEVRKILPLIRAAFEQTAEPRNGA